MPRPISLPEGVSIAPLARRVIGGLIDALPAIVGLFAMAWRYVQLFPTYGGETWKAMLDDPIFRWWGLGGSAIYLIHTLVAELFTHRSLGKMICGLRVADLNGDPPTAQAIVVRNVLRLIDVPMGALGAMGAVMDLVIMVYSPLRQRLGDIVARTLVVRGTPRLDEQTGQPIRKRQAPVDDGGEDEEGEPNEIRDCAGEQ